MKRLKKSWISNGNTTRYALPRLQTTSSHHFLTRWKLQKRLETSIIQDLEISRAPTFLNKFDQICLTKNVTNFFNTETRTSALQRFDFRAKPIDAK